MEKANICVSIIMNCYNGEKYLQEAITSMSWFYSPLKGWENCTKAVRIEALHHATNETLKKITNWI